jgi:hypothetical protein
LAQELLCSELSKVGKPTDAKFNFDQGVAMKSNEGNVDRIIRVAVGLGLLSLVFIGPQTAWGWVGLVPLLTGLVGFCPLYKVFGMNTCPLSSRSKI